MDNLVSRKFILAILIIAGTFALVVLGKTGSEEFIRLSEIVLGIYSAANVGSKIIDK